MTYDEIINAVENGAKFTINFQKRTCRVNGKIVMSEEDKPKDTPYLTHAGVPVMATVKDNIVELKCIPQPYRSTDKLDDFGNAVIKNLTEDECHLTTYMVPAYKQYIDDEREGDAKLLISFSIYEDEATISFHWNVPKD